MRVRIRSLILVSSIAALAACGAISRPPAQPGSGEPSAPSSTAPAFSERTLAAHVQPSGKPIEGCAVELSLPHSGKFTGLTSAQGYLAWQVRVPSPDPGGGLNAKVSIACPGFLVFEDSFVIAAEGNQDVTFGGGAALGNQAMLRAGPESVVAPAVARRGQVRLCGGTLCDDDGPLNALGVSLFWSQWGFEHDKDRLVTKNLAYIKKAGIIDFKRNLGAVGPGGEWGDRIIDPTSFGYEIAMAGDIDLGYEYGVRTAITIFGGVEFTPTPASRRAVIERVARVVNERKHKVMWVEIANEGWQNGFGGADGIAELRELERYFKSLAPGVLTALTAPEDSGEYSPCAVYAGSGADLATMHYDRAVGDTVKGRNYRAVRQAWGFPSEYEDKGACHGALGRFKAVSNEPISQYSSVVMEKDARVIAAAFRSSIKSGNVAYVWHIGAGVRGGNAFELGNSKPYLPRPANIADDPTWNETVAALTASKALLPAGAAAWQRFNAQWAGAPIKRLDDAVGAGLLVRGQAIVNGDRFQVEVLGIRGPLTAQASEAMELDIVDGATGKVLKHLTLAKDETFTIDTDLTDVCLVGRFTSFALPKAA